MGLSCKRNRKFYKNKSIKLKKMKTDKEKIYNLFNNQKFDQVEKLLEKIDFKNNTDIDYFFLYGIILAKKGKYEEAIYYFQKTLKFNKNNYDSNFNLGGCYQGLFDFNMAIHHYSICTKLEPKSFQPYFQLGICYKQMREYEKSIFNLDIAKNLEKNSKIFIALGNVYREIGNFDEALDYYKKAISIDKEPFDAQLLVANLEIDKGNLEIASLILNELNSNGKLNNSQKILLKIHHGNLLKSQGKYSDAIEVNKSILEISPKNYDASYNLSICYLFKKDYDKGWFYHESRFYLNNFGLLRQINNNFKKPRWDQSRPKKNILIWGEQGIGDQILYSQFVDLIKNEFENITIAVNDKLIPFFKKIYNDLHVIDYKKISKYQNYDFQIALGSLGLYFQKLVNKNFKVAVDYPIDAKRFPKKNKKLRCGISWRSTNKLIGHKKSIDLVLLREVLALENIEFINLQFSDVKNEVNNLENSMKRKIFNSHDIDNFNDIDGIASLIKTCDFVITISNSNAHISGKLGVKTFLLLPKSDGKLWYWGQSEDKEIIWYPSIIPIRQTKNSHWKDCIDRIIQLIGNVL